MPDADVLLPIKIRSTGKIHMDGTGNINASKTDIKKFQFQVTG